jgi:hypothetical protein
MRPVLDSSTFVPVTTLPRRTCHHSASSVLTVRISCRVIALFVFRKPLFINYTSPYLCMLHEYHVIYSVRYYLWFHVTTVGLGTYSVHINYRRISLRHNLSEKCRKIIKFVSITHSERNIWNGSIVATAISREKRIPV